MKLSCALISFFLFFSSCIEKTNQPDPKPDNKNFNFIVLLDLSDRINEESQIDRDKELINLIIDKFERLVKQSQFAKSKDCLQIIVAPQQQISVNAQIANKLKIDMATSEKIKDDNGKEMYVNTKDGFDLKKKEILKNIDQLYDPKSKTPGADIYGFFKNSLANTYLRDSNQFYNKLFIITDGYLAFDNSQKRPRGTYISNNDLGKLRNNKDWVNIFEKNNMRLDSFKDGETRPNYQNLQIMMVEINPKNIQQFTNELDILKKIWKTWFEDLDIQAPEILQREQDVKATESKINNFINQSPLKEKINEQTQMILNFRGDNYSLHSLNNSEIVKGNNGYYFYVDIRQSNDFQETGKLNSSLPFALFWQAIDFSQIDTSKKKIILFDIGKFEIPFTQVEKGLTEFSTLVTKELENKNISYNIYIKGKADILSFEGYQNRYGNSEQLCYLPFNSRLNSFENNPKCESFKEQITNNDLPNLRAFFLREKFRNIYSNKRFKFKDPILLEGKVENVISTDERNGTIILFIKNK